jgi:hypothetical protein
MTTRQNFTEQEWALLQRALPEPGRYLILADPTSVADITKATRAMAGAFSDVRDQASRLGLENKLLESLLLDTSQASQDANADAPFPNLGSPEYAALKSKSLANIAQASALLDAKATPEEAKDIKIRMYQLAGETAAASKQGGFLGFGGVRVTDAEKAALAEVAAALKIDPADATESWGLPGQE